MSDVQRDELVRRLGEEGLVLLDVRSPGEFDGEAGYPCDARQGHLPGARNLDLQLLLAAADDSAIRALVGAPEGAEVIAYCHSGSRSAMAVELLSGGRLRRAQLRRLLARVGAAEPRPTRSSKEGPRQRDEGRPVPAARSRNAPQSRRPCSFHVPRCSSVSRRTAAGSGSSASPSTNQWSSM